MSNIYYQIVSIDTSPNGDVYREVETFDRRKDAEQVLLALEKVNYIPNRYKIIEVKYESY